MYENNQGKTLSVFNIGEDYKIAIDRNDKAFFINEIITTDKHYIYNPKTS